MTDGVEPKSLVRHRFAVAIAGLAGGSGLVAFRGLIEFGFAPTGSLRIGGVPLEYFCVLWFLALWSVVADGHRLVGSARVRATAYEFWLGIIGLAGTMWLVQNLATAQLLRSASWVYWLACACALVVFLSAASVERPRTFGFTRNALPDVLRILRRPLTWISAVGGIAMLAFAPRSLETPTEGRAFQRWYSKQVRLSVPASWQTKPVTLVELIDYQCPVCRRAATEYREVIHRTESTYGDSFGFLRVDFPLDNECNSVTGSVSPGGPHPAACEAAAAVRLAKTAGADREREVIEWLWAHQARLTPAKVFDGISERFGLDVRQNYNTLLQAISQDAAEGRRLHVSGTPTFFLNGRRLPLLRAATLEVAIGIELKLLSRNAQRGKQ